MLHTRFCRFGADLHARWVLINKISASELTRKFIKSASLVGVSLYMPISTAIVSTWVFFSTHKLMVVVRLINVLHLFEKTKMKF